MQTEQKAGRFSLIPSLPALPRRRLLAACALAFGLTWLAAAPGQAGTLTIESELGKGTTVMQLRRNQSVPRSIASWLTAVGLRRVSIGPPISVIERGAQGSDSASMRAMAAMTGTDGWQIAMTCVSGPSICSMPMT